MDTSNTVHSLIFEHEKQKTKQNMKASTVNVNLNVNGMSVGPKNPLLVGLYYKIVMKWITLMMSSNIFFYS